MEQEQILVKVEQVSRFYGPLAAVEDISFEVRRGEVLGFLGPNGAGKSTTMRMLTGNLAPSTGRIEINGIDLLDQARAAKEHLGYLPEQPPVYRELTVLEYLDYCAALNRIPRNRRDEARQRALDKCGLDQVRDRLIGNLSKGYQQRVGIAQAIIHSPAIVILDEPTVGLDPIQIREIRDLIKEIGRDHSVILSTHILPEVQSVCDRVQIINKGRLVFSDSITALRERLDRPTLIVKLKSPPPLADLASVPGVTEVEALSETRFKLHHGDSDPTATLLEQAVREGWQLCEIYPDRRSLEQVFMDVTSMNNDPATDAEQEATQ